MLAKLAGFDVVYLGGWATGARTALLEPPLTMAEQVNVAAEIVDRTGLPLLVDAHTGFGAPIHIHRMVSEFEKAGISGIHIEDQVFPKRANYHRGTSCQKLSVGLKQRSQPVRMLTSSLWPEPMRVREEGNPFASETVAGRANARLYQEMGYREE